MQHPIGIFDSGYGGLTVMKDIVKKLPQYDYLYLGDNARAPYGDRSFQTVYLYTLQCVKWLFSQGCHLVILACNTASAKALRTIQQKDLEKIAPGKRVLGVIRPTSEIIGQYSKSGHIGVMGTTGTVQSGSYEIEIKKFFPGIHVTQEACPMWVPLVENNEYNKEGADFFIRGNIDDIIRKDPQIDTLLLACTHYPLLMDKIRALTPAAVSIVQQGAIVADSLANYLERHPEISSRCSKDGQRMFYTTGEPVEFEVRGTDFYGQPIEAQHVELG
jgi:glutamate racemase